MSKQAENKNENNHPKCHFKPMEWNFSDYETWWECSVCGHTILVDEYTGEH